MSTLMDNSARADTLSLAGESLQRLEVSFISLCISLLLPPPTLKCCSLAHMQRRKLRGHLLSSIPALDDIWAVLDGAWSDLFPDRL